MNLPQHGLDRQTIFATLHAYKQHDVNWRSGKLLAGVYDPGDDNAATIKEAYTEFLTENALFLNFYPSVIQLENDVTRMVINLLQGDANAVGNCTSGGTESIMLSVKAARDWARVERNISAPEIIVPITAHAAFHKAAHYLGCKIIVTPVNPLTFRADVNAMQAAITPNTILLVGSAPCYAQGVIDPIGEIAALAQSQHILCHVDACVGGIHLSIMRKLGYSLPAFDFSVPGVTSISTDMHKYGYAAKNISVAMFRHDHLRKFAMFACANTASYAVLNPSVLSTRSAGPMAGAWAALMSFGEAGYADMVQRVQTCTAEMITAVNATPGLRILGQPVMSMFAIASDEINIFDLDDEMAARDWMLQPQFSTPDLPANLHAGVHLGNVAHVGAFAADLQAAVLACRAKAVTTEAAHGLKDQVLQLLQQPLSPQVFGQLLQLGGLTPGQLPNGFGRINTVLDMLPRDLVNVLLVEYMNSIYR